MTAEEFRALQQELQLPTVDRQLQTEGIFTRWSGIEDHATDLYIANIARQLG